MPGDAKKLIKVLGITQATDTELDNILKLVQKKPSVGLPMLEDLCKKEKVKSDYETLMKALKAAGL